MSYIRKRMESSAQIIISNAFCGHGGLLSRVPVVL